MNPTTAFTARGALAALAFSMLLSSLGTSIANVALPTLADVFAASFSQVQWVVLAYLLAVTLSIVLAGRLGDVLGRRRLLLAGIVLFTLASFFCGAAPSLELLVAARALQGLGAAVLMALSLAFVSDVLPAGKTGSAMGLLGATSAIGTALGPSLGGFLISGFGWRAIFWVQVPLGLLALLLAWRFLPAGARAPAPPLRLALLGEKRLAAGLATSLLVAMVMMGTLVVGPFYLAQALALDPARVGLAMSAGPLVAALTGWPAGRSVDRWGGRPMVLVGLAGLLAGCFALALLPARLGIAGYLVPVTLLTASYALFQAANNTAVMAAAGAPERGTVSGLLNLSRNLGLVCGTSLLGAVFTRAAGTELGGAATTAVAGGMRSTFAVAALLMAVALAVATTTAARR